MVRETALQTIEAVWRIEAPRLIAGLTRLVRDVGLAEELAQDALVAAVEQWPQDGVPDTPGAWLMAIAKRRGIDQIRRAQLISKKHELLGSDPDALQPERVDLAEKLDGSVGDDVLRLMFIACHPVLPSESRAALTLKLLGGLTTPEIARAFLVPEPTVAQRIVRAKKTLTEAQVPFEMPPPKERATRLESVLEVIYLIFNEGYSATAGDDWLRPELCSDALRLGRMIAAQMPQEPEALGLVALMEIQASRSKARVGPTGEPVLLLEQNRAQWDHLLINRGLTALQRAIALSDQQGPYTLQAAIAACHARARTPEATDWNQIARLYAKLAALNPSPVIELNRAVAVAMSDGPAAGLALVDALRDDPSLARYHLYPSVRGDLLAKLGRMTEASAELERAAGLTQNSREQKLLRARAAELREKASP